VCVTPSETIDAAIWLARQPDVCVFTFGDMLRVPGATGTLADAATAGSVQMMYSPLQAVEYAQKHPATTVVLFGIGFETTAPTLAAALETAAQAGLVNFFMLAAGKMTPPAMRALLGDAGNVIDGFIAPGHVTTVIGADAYRFIPDAYGKPCVVAGFELCDLLDALGMLVAQLALNRHEVEIQYKRSATCAGNPRAQQAIADVFVPVDSAWRGLGMIPLSGYALAPAYGRFDVRTRFDLPAFPPAHAPGCRCGDMLRGICVPTDCPLFDKACTPDTPVGPCMVSSEGSCAAYYKYRG
jgi:hydrogenase expression/formation protein HypD